MQLATTAPDLGRCKCLKRLATRTRLVYAGKFGCPIANLTVREWTVDEIPKRFEMLPAAELSPADRTGCGQRARRKEIPAESSLKGLVSRPPSANRRNEVFDIFVPIPRPNSPSKFSRNEEKTALPGSAVPSTLSARIAERSIF
jgi:hypothetical protein